VTTYNQDFEVWAGEDKTLSCTVVDSAGAAQDITDATVNWFLRAGPTATSNVLTKSTASGITITNALGGAYSVAIADTDTAALSGTYWHYAQLTDAGGHVTVIMEGWATFNPTRCYATLAQMKGELGVGQTDTTDDALLIGALEAASRWVDEWCGRRFYTTALDETRYYTALRSDRLLLGDDLLSVTALSTDADGDRTYETAWAVTDYDLTPDNAALDGAPYWAVHVTPVGSYSFPVGVRRGVKIVGRFGYAATAPAAVRKATLLRAIQLFRLKDAPFGSIGGEGMGPVATPLPVWGIVQSLLAPYRRLAVG
jgi:hypothetical protein